MKNMLKHIIICACVAIMALPSCDYLDIADNFEESFKWDSIFVSKRNLERYV